MRKSEAQAIAETLKPCPFCGCKPVATLLGAGENAPNPRAKCPTEDCMGGKLPSICLDVQEQVDAWNIRAN